MVLRRFLLTEEVQPTGSTYRVRVRSAEPRRTVTVTSPPADPSARAGVWDAVQRWLRRPPVLVDVALALLLSVLTALAVRAPDGVPDQRSWGVGVFLALLGSLVVAVRSRVPVAAFVVALPASLAAFWLGHDGGNNGLGALFCLYSVAALRNRRTGAVAGVTSALAVGVVLSLAPAAEVGVREVAVNVLAVCLFWGAGAWSRTRAEYVRGLEERTAALELARASHERAVLVEARGTVAREMQDVVGHDVMAMTVQVAAARRLVTRDPAGAERALAEAERLGRSAVREVHRVLGLLGDPDEVVAGRPQPGLAEIADLVADARAAGLHVDYAGTDLDLEPGPALAVHRVVEEALRNVLAHAGPASVVVDLRRVGSSVQVTVTDDGRGAPSWRAHGTAGVGMLSLQQRVESYGGTLTAGSRRGGGYEVRAELPAGTVVAAAGGRDGSAR